MSLDVTSGVRSAVTNNLVKYATVSGGVAAGRSTPIQAEASKSLKPDVGTRPLPYSATVGTAGNAAILSRPVAASTRNLPDATCSITPEYVATRAVTCSPKSAVTAGASPGNGT